MRSINTIISIHDTSIWYPIDNKQTTKPSVKTVVQLFCENYKQKLCFDIIFVHFGKISDGWSTSPFGRSNSEHSCYPQCCAVRIPLVTNSLPVCKVWTTDGVLIRQSLQLWCYPKHSDRTWVEWRSRIWLTLLFLCPVGARPTGGPAISKCRNNKCPCHVLFNIATPKHICNQRNAEMVMGFWAVFAGRDRR